MSASSGLTEYIAEHHNFRRHHVEYDPVSNSTHIVVRGLAMRPLQPFPAATESGASNFDRFLAQRCVARVNGRVACKDLTAEFCRWLGVERMSTADRKDRCDRMNLRAVLGKSDQYVCKLMTACFADGMKGFVHTDGYQYMRTKDYDARKKSGIASVGPPAPPTRMHPLEQG
jgi:hypothetical protein